MPEGDAGALTTMTTMMVIRRPVPTDAAGLGRAWEDAREFYSDLDSRVFLPPSPEDRELGQAIVQRLVAEEQLPGRWIRVADESGEAVGFITATLHEPEENASRDIIGDSTRRRVKIDTLVVQRSHWRAGAGRALVESVEGWAQQVEASLLKVGTYARGPAVAFYEALGYGRRSIIFEKYLD
jgi:GNAT superfamily N-acetyltransferase